MAYPPFNNPQLDQQIQRYLTYLKTEGPPDLLIIGSSRARQGLDPLVLAQALERRGFGQLRVFNFGINGATAQVVQMQLEQLLPPGQWPKVLIWADGSRAFNSGRPDRTYARITESAAYGLLQAGTRPCLSDQGRVVAAGDGCVVAIAQAQSQLPSQSQSQGQAQIQSQIQSQLLLAEVKGLEKPPPAMRWCVQLRGPCATVSERSSLGGFDLAAVERVGFNPVLDAFVPATYFQAFPKVPGQYDGDYKDFDLGGVQGEALEKVLALVNERRIPLVFVHMPLTGVYLDAARSRHETAFRTHMMQVAAGGHFRFVDLSGRWRDRHDYFADPSHLNYPGAMATAAVLGEQWEPEWQVFRAPVQVSPKRFTPKLRSKRIAPKLSPKRPKLSPKRVAPKLSPKRPKLSPKRLAPRPR